MTKDQIIAEAHARLVKLDPNVPVDSPDYRRHHFELCRVLAHCQGTCHDFERREFELSEFVRDNPVGNYRIVCTEPWIVDVWSLSVGCYLGEFFTDEIQRVFPDVKLPEAKGSYVEFETATAHVPIAVIEQ